MPVAMFNPCQPCCGRKCYCLHDTAPLCLRVSQNYGDVNILLGETTLVWDAQKKNWYADRLQFCPVFNLDSGQFGALPLSVCYNNLRFDCCDYNGRPSNLLYCLKADGEEHPFAIFPHILSCSPIFHAYGSLTSAVGSSSWAWILEVVSTGPCQLTSDPPCTLLDGCQLLSQTPHVIQVSSEGIYWFKDTPDQPSGNAVWTTAGLIRYRGGCSWSNYGGSPYSYDYCNYEKLYLDGDYWWYVVKARGRYLYSQPWYQMRYRAHKDNFNPWCGYDKLYFFDSDSPYVLGAANQLMDSSKYITFRAVCEPVGPCRIEPELLTATIESNCPLLDGLSVSLRQDKLAKWRYVGTSTIPNTGRSTYPVSGNQLTVMIAWQWTDDPWPTGESRTIASVYIGCDYNAYDVFMDICSTPWYFLTALSYSDETQSSAISCEPFSITTGPVIAKHINWYWNCSDLLIGGCTPGSIQVTLHINE